MRFFLIFCILATLLRGAAPSFAEESSEHPVLTDDHCLLCHKKPARDIEAAGMGHKEFTSCVSCHDGHPPEKFDIIPACNLCHVGQPHYELEECLSCHLNPHRPLEIRFLKDSADACVTCHDQQGQQLENFPSFHSQLDCTSCHESHNDIPECLNCHKSHSAGMVQAQCLTCHNGHSPLAVSYAQGTPTESCTGCHADTWDTLVIGGTKHQSVSCSDCHQSTHGNIPECSQCHAPHSEEISAGVCQDCHRAHDPLPVNFPSDLPSSACAACHQTISAELAQINTLHTELHCAECHERQHGSSPLCTLCHAPHSADMSESACTDCHQPHRPAPVVFAPKTPSKSCGACHPVPWKSLQGNRTRHSELPCLSCHREQHGSIPNCQECHGIPHQTREIFPNCSDCHISAHDLLL